MVKISNVALQNDGEFIRLSVAWDEFDNTTGKIIATNQRETRIVTDEDVLQSVEVVMNLAKDIADGN